MNAANVVPATARRVPDSTRVAKACRMMRMATDLIEKINAHRLKAIRALYTPTPLTYEEARRLYDYHNHRANRIKSHAVRLGAQAERLIAGGAR